MTEGEIYGTAGVAALLVAFGLNLAGKLSSGSRVYLLMNFSGATLAMISSYLISFWPFVVLEGVWALSSLFALIKPNKK